MKQASQKMAKLDASNKDGINVKITGLNAAIKKKGNEILRRSDEAIKRIPQREIREIGDIIIDGMLERIARGQSPIQGKNRFPKYKNPLKYPGKRKPKVPVNLYLTGQFLKSLKSTAIAGGGTLERIVNINLDNRLARLKEEGHRIGHNGQPERPIIPIGSEKFQPRILIAAKRAYIELVKDYLKRRGLI